MKKWRIIVLVLGLMMSFVYANSQTITSKSTGGNWSDVNTWVGGVVPGANNDVVIAGNIQITPGATCKNLTVNSGITLQANGIISLYISGNVINNGLIIPHKDNWSFSIYISGNINNNGTWKPHNTYLNGTGDQEISQGTGKSFEGDLFQNSDSLGIIKAKSTITFRARTNFNVGYPSYKWTTLDMLNNKLVLDGINGGYLNGNLAEVVILNPGDIELINSGVLGNASVKGNPNLKGRFWIGPGVTFEGTTTITDTLIGNGIAAVTFKGNIINNGWIKPHPDNWSFSIYISGNITNNGVWRPHNTYLNGIGDQEISQGTGKFFEGDLFQNSDSLGIIKAKSTITFRARTNFNVGYPSYKWTTLDMLNNKLVLDGINGGYLNGNLAEVVIINPGDIELINGGVLGNASVKGNPNLKGRFWIGPGVTFEGTTTITDTLIGNGIAAVTFKGNIINNGWIKPHPDNWSFSIYISGNITNNGVWRPHNTYLNGTGDQEILQGTDKSFEGDLFQNSDSLGMIKAKSTISFRARTNFNVGYPSYKWTTLDMQNYKLILDGINRGYLNGSLSDLVITNPGEIECTSNGYLNNAYVKGDVKLIKSFIISNGVTFDGNVTVIDTLQAAGLVSTTVLGNIINNGTVRKHPDNWGFTFTINGNMINNGTWKSSTINLAGDGLRTINGQNTESTFQLGAGNIILAGNNYLPNLYIAYNKLTLASDAILKLPTDAEIQFGSSSGFESYGKIMTSKKTTATQNYNLYGAVARVMNNSGIDTVFLEYYEHQVPSSFSNAVKRWWRLKTSPFSKNLTLSTLSLYYDHSTLGNNDENTLQVFYSQDSGKTWKQLSTSQNITRNASGNILTISDVPANGDYLLSSSADPTSVRPSIIVSLIGRENIRVGVPNRYAIQYVNNSDVATGDMLMQIKTTEAIHIKQVEPSMPPGKKQEIFPIDSLTFDKQDSVVMLWISSMAPREERTLNVVLTPTPDGMLKRTEDQALFLPLIIIAIEWVGTAIVIDYTADVAMEVGKELWRPVPVDCASLLTALKNAVLDGVGKTNYEWFGYEKPVATISQEAAQELIKKTGFESVEKLAVAKKILDATGKQIEGMKDYVEGKSEVLDCGGNKKKLTGEVSSTTKSTRKVTSWDPNEKNGPQGFGEQRFITSAGRMTYQILFENKKEATAPAYKVAIVDTLRPEFDAETFVFGKTSHDAAQYIWKKTRTGNIVKWEIEGIELPPNANPPEGEGWVIFSVQPKSGLSSGTTLRNSATIIFDMNKPITTNEASNTLDFKAPSTVMNSTQQKFTGNKFIVKWKSSDELNGSGVESTTLYVSKDNGTYLPFGTTKSDSIAFTPESGTHKYSFYAIAKDNVGNVEMTHPTAVTTDITSALEVLNRDLPNQYTLSQNYPNPFNPSTTIEFSIPKSCDVSIIIYNLLGQEVKTLINGMMNPGSYKIEWQAGSYSSGVYYYRMKTNEFSETRKLILLK